MNIKELIYRTHLNVVRSKADISTSTDPAKMISYYENSVLKQLTQDQFATKFGLLYIYNMAFEGDYKGTVRDRGLLCPQGWTIPSTMNWLDVAMEMGASSLSDAQNNAAEYLGSTDRVRPLDEDLVFTPENVGYDGYAHVTVKHPVYGRSYSWFVMRPKALSEGLVKNAGLNIYPTGNAGLPHIRSNDGTGDFIAHNRHFGSYAYFLNIANGALYLRSYKEIYSNENPPVIIDTTPQMGGSIGDTKHASVRCIKVVE